MSPHQPPPLTHTPLPPDTWSFLLSGFTLTRVLSTTGPLHVPSLLAAMCFPSPLHLLTSNSSFRLQQGTTSSGKPSHHLQPPEPYFPFRKLGTVENFFLKGLCISDAAWCLVHSEPPMNRQVLCYCWASQVALVQEM